ncbi:MAG: SDR family oxidoreductase [Elusimicrobia bacterium]|nr:SDR family oxidoreductase [Elusimicrobiota bacterium]
MLELKGKTALITGGAGGLGFATALALGREGMKVALWDLNGKRAEERAAALRAGGVTAKGWGLDVTDPTAVREGAIQVERELGPVDLLDNNAGIHAPGDFLASTDEEIKRQVDVNLNSYMWCAKAFVPGMIARNSGHVIMIASAAGLLGVPGMTVYSATKHAVIGFAESLRMELRRGGAAGVGMTIVCPSFIDTGMFPNTTPPLFTPWLKPEALAEKIVAAVRSNRLYVREPAMVKLIPLVKALPRAVGDALCSLTGMDRSLQGPPPKKP